MEPASAVKLIAWMCAPATGRDPQSVLSQNIFNLYTSHVPKKKKSSVVRARHSSMSGADLLCTTLGSEMREDMKR